MGYQVVLSGGLRDGVDPETARRHIVALFAIENPAALDAFFSGREIVLKSNLDRVRAGRYLAALRHAGFECDVRPPLETDAVVRNGNVLRLPQRHGMRVAAVAATPEVESPRKGTRRPPRALPSAWFPLMLILLAALWLLLEGAHTLAPQEESFGRKKLLAVTLPATLLADFNAMPAAAPSRDKLTLDRTLSAFGASWTDAKARLFTAADSPYTLVLRLQARALADGEASAAATVGYAMQGKARSALLHLGKERARAGERFTITRAGPVTHFVEDRRRALHVVLGNRRNISVERIEVEVWSGRNGFNMHWTLYAMLGLVVLRFAMRLRSI